MSNVRQGRQTPTQSVVLPYTQTKGNEAVKIYNQSGNKALEWQRFLCDDLMAVDENGLWIHQKFGFSVPRRNGKGEILVMRELWGLINGEQICHTAHRTTTSSAAWVRMTRLLAKSGYVELGRAKKDEIPPDKSYRTNKQHGLESITLTNGGTIVFRTRTPNGGLGEGFDLLVIDEAQEYTDAQETALVYTVTDSENPQTILCGTPPTEVSSGTVFLKMREDTLKGDTFETGWAEWSIPKQTDDVYNTELWYETNPSMGAHLNERKIRSEIRGDKIDFNIQRLGVWLQYNQKSEISEADWDQLAIDRLPELKGQIFVGIKYGADSVNVSMSIAIKTVDNRIFIESIDCQSIRKGDDWIIRFLKEADVRQIVIDGRSGQSRLADELKDAKIKSGRIVLPKVGEVITASTMFNQAIDQKLICHKNQPSLKQSACNCEKRSIGSGGGYGFRSLREGIDVSLLESAVLAHWACAVSKERRKQKVRF